MQCSQIVLITDTAGSRLCRCSILCSNLYNRRHSVSPVLELLCSSAYALHYHALRTWVYFKVCINYVISFLCVLYFAMTEGPCSVNTEARTLLFDLQNLNKLSWSLNLLIKNEEK